MIAPNGPSVGASPQHLEEVASELKKLAQEDIPRREFLQQWLSKTDPGKQVRYSAVYESSPAGFRPLAEHGLAIAWNRSDEATAKRNQLRRKVIETGESTWEGESLKPVEGGTATHWVTFIEPIGGGAIESGVVEVTVEARTPPFVRSGCATLVSRTVRFIDDFLNRQEIRELSQLDQLNNLLFDFAAKIDEQVEVKTVAYTIVNEARKLLDCDRVTLLRCHRGRNRVIAVSGVDSFDERAQEIKQLVSLADAAAASGEEFSNQGAESPDPEVRNELSRYCELRALKHVAGIPLLRKSADDKAPPSTTKPEPIGWLVVERVTSDAVPPAYLRRVSFTVDRATSAFRNAVEHERVPFFSMLRKVGRMRDRLSKPATLCMIVGIGAAIFALIGFVAFSQTDLTMEAEATFQPVVRQDIFPPEDGTVSGLHVRHGTQVKVGEKLLTIRSAELDMAITETRGERVAKVEQLSAAERSLFGEEERLTAEEHVRISGRCAELRQAIKAIDEKLVLLERRRERLTIKSPINGEVITWDLERRLRDRPISRGQSLLTVADLTRDWELEVYLPEYCVGHLTQAEHDAPGALEVRFRPTSDPSREFVGKIKKIDSVAEVRGERGNTVLVTVVIDRAQFPALKPGLEATAKVYCGRRSRAYVWLHPIVDFLRVKVWFRWF